MAVAHHHPAPDKKTAQEAFSKPGATSLMPAAKPKEAPKGDPLIARVDEFAGQLLTAAQAPVQEGAQPVDFRDKLDVLKELVRWVAVKKGLDSGDNGGGIDEFKRRLREDDSAADKGAPRRFGPRRVISRPPNSGGNALDAIKGRLPDANPGDHAGGRNGAQRASVGAAGSLGQLYPGGDGDE